MGTVLKIKKLRVYTVAKKVGAPSKEVQNVMRGLGQNVRSYSSPVEPVFAQTVVAHMRNHYGY